MNTLVGWPPSLLSYYIFHLLILLLLLEKLSIQDPKVDLIIDLEQKR